MQAGILTKTINFLLRKPRFKLRNVGFQVFQNYFRKFEVFKD